MRKVLIFCTPLSLLTFLSAEPYDSLLLTAIKEELYNLVPMQIEKEKSASTSEEISENPDLAQENQMANEPSPSLTFVTEDQQEPISPEVVEKQLESAESDFRKAKKMFNPWYTGPLITPSASLLPPGYFNMQPYLFVTDNHHHFNSHGKSQNIPDLVQLKGQIVLQAGVCSWLNVLVSPQFVRNKQDGHYAARFGDTSVGLNAGILKEGSYTPGIVLAVAESFPSGAYQKLNPEKGGVDATGAGAFGTTISLNFGKVVWWWFFDHPMNFRLSLGYEIFTDVHVTGFNAYGGGFGTRGKVHPGGVFSFDFGYELSFSQRWVFALDVVYTYQSQSYFTGHPGRDATGAPAANGAPFNDQFSLAPALEYNLSSNFGFIAGVWFTPWGRNSFDFVSGVFSFTYTW